MNYFLLLCFLTSPLRAQTIFINQTVRHPALDETVRGIKESLPGTLKVEVHCAQGSPTLAYQIAQKTKKTDLALGVGTLAALSFQGFQGQKAFTSVTDPKGSGLPGPGVSNFVPLAPQLALIRRIQPDMKRLGTLYNPGELNSVKMVELLEAEKGNLLIFKAPVRSPGEIPQALGKLLSSGVQGIFINNDNTVLSGLPALVALASQKQIPVYTSDTDTVEASGALAALGPNQYELGQQTGRMILRMLQGEKLQTVEYPEKTELVLNQAKARELGLTFPQDLKTQAQKVVGL
jgi:putative ABC transport system substrate-binding protein